MRSRKKIHPPYYPIFPLLELERVTREEAAEHLGMVRRTFDDKVLGYGDFSVQDAFKLSVLLKRKWSEIFLTENVSISTPAPPQE